MGEAVTKRHVKPLCDELSNTAWERSELTKTRVDLQKNESCDKLSKGGSG